jgi:hypothetical protein
VKYDVENSTLRSTDDSNVPFFVYGTTPTVQFDLVKASGAIWPYLPTSGSAVLSVDNDWTRSTDVCARKTISFLNPLGTLTFPDVNFNTVKMGTVTDGADMIHALCQVKVFSDGNPDPVRIFTFEVWLVNLLDVGDPAAVPDPSPESYYLPRSEYVAGTLREGDVVSIGAGVRTVAVTFDREQPAAPTSVVVSVMVPTGTSDFITAVVDASTITATGFTAILSALTPNANFKLSYFILK